MSRPLQFVFLLMVGACAPSGPDVLAPGGSEPATADNLRPSDAPDVVVFSFSGHVPYGDFNEEYLVANGGTPVVIAEIFQQRGFRAETWGYGDEFYSHGGNDFGFLGAVEDLGFVHEEWVADFDNPTRVIFVGHSHGGVWAHTLAALAGVEDVAIDVLVTLDSVTEGWESSDWITGYVGDDWQQVIDDFNADNGLTFDDWGFDFAELGGWYLPGIAAEQTIDDIVFANVGVNLEYQSSSPLGLSDWEDNHRGEDGSTLGVITRATGELHGDSFGGGIAGGSSIATAHAVESIESFYFPD